MGRDALVVGINTYQHLPNLKTPGNDAEAIAQRLEQDGEFRVWRLPEVVIDGKPTVGQRTAVSLAELKQALVKLFKPDSDQYADSALLYFSGHGLRETLGIAEGYLATSDVNPQQDFWGLSLRWLRRLLEESPVRQQIIWLDCCHGGELLSFGEADPGDRALARDRSFIAASRAYEPAYEEITGNHSVLTQALLDGLEPTRLRDRWVTNLALTDFINETLKTEIQTPVCNNAGEPINLTRAWQQAVATAPKTLKTDNAICPYRGLSYFDDNNEDYRYFYGRQSLTDELLDAVRQSNFVAIAGASGSGKSSVLRAGLLHQLRLGRRIFGSDQWEIRLMVPGETPCQNLAAAFVDENLPRLERAKQQGDAEELINKGAKGLRDLVKTSEAQRVLLVIDQFEEVFTLCQDTAERERFFGTVLGALNTTVNQLGVILAMRADFVGRCFEQAYSGLAERVQNHLVAVKPMDREELRDAIVKPAEQVGLTLEPELVTTLLNDVEKAPGSLPLLQYTLTELWQQRQDDTLRLTPYAQLGGVTGTLKKRADAVYQQLTPAQQRTAKHIFLNLTQLGEGAEDTRRRVAKSNLVTVQHLSAVVDEVVKWLADANLVITNELTRKGDGSRVAVVDVAHEALIRNWPKLRQWLEENRDLIRQQRKIELAAQEWEARGKQAGYLFQGRQLSDAKVFQKNYAADLPLSQLGDRYVRNSLSHRRNNRIKLFGLGAVIPLILATYSGLQIATSSRLRPYWEVVHNYDPDSSNDIPKSALIWALGEINRANRSLAEIDLSNADLSNADLRSAFLVNANLSNTNLSNGYLPGAYFRDANLSDANLSDANLSYAYLRGASMRNSNLNEANLGNANLIDVYLRNADLVDTNLRNANLSNADLVDTNLRNANLSDANLYNTNLRGADLNNANLSDANLSNADLAMANLVNVNLNNTNLGGAILLATNLRETKELSARQLSGRNPPLLCNSFLPKGIDIDPNRDCDQLLRVLRERPFNLKDIRYFGSLQAIRAYVEEARQITWD